MCPWPGGAGPSAPTRRAQSCQHKRGTKRCPALGRRAKLRRELYIWQSWSDSETTESEIRSCQHVERVATCRIQQAIARRNRRSESFSVRAHVTPPTKPRWAIPRTEPSSRGYLLRGSACHSRSGRCCTKKVCGMLEHVGLCGSAQRAVWKRSTCLGIDAGATGFGTVAITSHLVVCRTRHCRTDRARPSTSLAESWPARRADVRAPLSCHNHYPEHRRGWTTGHSSANQGMHTHTGSGLATRAWIVPVLFRPPEFASDDLKIDCAGLTANSSRDETAMRPRSHLPDNGRSQT